MWKSVTLGWPALAMLALSPGNSALGDQEELLRYRGEYTHGHEVRSFCPDTNSQCYWVGGDTPVEIQVGLRLLAANAADTPYTPVCVIIEGRIDRESERTGFAADYDGLITVTRIVSPCD